MLLCYLLSLWLTVRAVRAAAGGRRRLLQLLSALSVGFAVVTVEYLIGLEVLRLVLLFLILLPVTDGRRALLQRAARELILPWTALLLFLIWRLFLFESLRSETDLSTAVLAPLAADPLGWAAGRAWQLLLQPWQTLTAWLLVPWQITADGMWRLPVWLLLLIVSAAAAAAVILRHRPAAAAVPRLPMLLLLALVAAAVPVVLTGRPFQLLDPDDRYTWHLLPAAAPLTALLLRRLPGRLPALLLAGLLLLGSSSQAVVLQQYADDWQQNRQLWQQLAVRRPTLERGTFLVVDRPAEQRLIVAQPPYVVWGPGNMVYRGAAGGYELTGYSLSRRPTRWILRDRRIPQAIRDVAPYGEVARLQPILVPDRGCVRLITPAVLRLPPPLSGKLRELTAARYAADWPQPVPAPALTAVLPGWLGRPDPQAWCTLLQQAELAEELGDDTALAQLTDRVLAAGLQPADVTEWRVYAEYLLRAGRTAEAEQLLPVLLSGSADAAQVCGWWQAVGGGACTADR